MRIRFCAALVVFGLLGGCAQTHMPFNPSRQEPGEGARLKPARDRADTGPSGRRQYYDQRHQRYYFYDPGRQAYFWDDGSPKS